MLLIGLSAPPLSVSGFADAFWIDPAVYQFAAFGVPQTRTPLAATVLVPNTAAFLGVRLVWQAVTVGTGGLEASNPTWSLVR